MTVLAVVLIVLFSLGMLAAFVGLAVSWDKSDREAYRLGRPYWTPRKRWFRRG